MLNRTSTTKILFGSGALAILLFSAIAIIKVFGSGSYYVEGQTTEYHPPATQDRQAAEETLQELEWTGENGESEALFIPENSEGRAVAVGTRLSHSIIDVDETTTVHAAVAVRAAESAPLERSALNLALVIDQSGSMHGLKLQQVKSASHQLIDALGPQDDLSLVTYDAQVRTLSHPVAVTPENSEKLHHLVDEIMPRGATNISGGYERGLELALRASGEDSINRVVLLSDGRANEGITDLDRLGALASDGLERGVSLTTMGVGYDYNEDIMQRMAMTGAGNYYFIGDENEMQAAFAAEMEALENSVARETKLTFQLPDGVTLVGVEGFAFEQDGNVATVDLDAFVGGEQKDLLLELEVEPRGVGHPVLLETSLTYEDVAAERFVRTTKRSRVAVMEGRTEGDATIMRRVQQIRTARAFDEAMRMYDDGDRFGGAQRLEEQRAANRRFMLRHDIEDPAFDRVNEELLNLAGALRKTERHTTKGKWISKSGKYRSSSISSSSVEF